METQLPLFPLTTALVPGLVLPLHIFEPRYRLMVEELLAKPEDEREFGVIAVRERHLGAASAPTSAANSPADMYPVGVTALVRQADRLDDGRYDILAIGSRRFSVSHIDNSAPLLRADVQFLPEPDADPEDPKLRSLVARAQRSFDRYRAVLGGRLNEEPSPDDDIPADPQVLSYLITAALVIDAGTRNELLASPDAQTRLGAGIKVLDRETTMIESLGAVPALDLLSNVPSEN